MADRIEPASLLAASLVCAQVTTARPAGDALAQQFVGMFHFGGSTHSLIFRPQVKLDFDLRGQTPGLDTKNIPVRRLIATAR
jgi:hypothetical protein